MPNELNTPAYFLQTRSCAPENFHRKSAAQKPDGKRNAILAGFCSSPVGSQDSVCTMPRSFAKRLCQIWTLVPEVLHPIGDMVGRWPTDIHTCPTKRAPDGCKKYLGGKCFRWHKGFTNRLNTLNMYLKMVHPSFRNSIAKTVSTKRIPMYAFSTGVYIFYIKAANIYRNQVHPHRVDISVAKPERKNKIGLQCAAFTLESKHG